MERLAGEKAGLDAGGADFVLTVDSVFRLAGRGTVVAGPVESGVIRTGDVVEICDRGGRAFLQARVRVESVTGTGLDPRTIALLVGDVDLALLSRGQIVRRRPAARLARMLRLALGARGLLRRAGSLSRALPRRPARS